MNKIIETVREGEKVEAFDTDVKDKNIETLCAVCGKETVKLLKYILEDEKILKKIIQERD